MITEWSRTQTTIGHLAVRYRGTTTDLSMPVLRLRTEHLLTSIDLHPRGLPSGAVLIVRKLHGPAPLSVSALLQTSQPGWTERLHDQMTTLVSTAARPALGSVSSSATSVLFADPGEMLASLTCDLLAGRAWQQWYWQQVLRGVPHAPGAALTIIWSEQAVFVPAALGGYMKMEEAQAAVALLSPTEVSRVTHTLHESFDLPAADGPPIAGQPVPGRPQESPLHVVPPWQSWLSSAALPALTPQAEYLLGLALTLYHAPTFARSPKFASLATSWLNAELATPTIRRGRILSGGEGIIAPTADYEVSLSRPVITGDKPTPDRPGSDGLFGEITDVESENSLSAYSRQESASAPEWQNVDAPDDTNSAETSPGTATPKSSADELIFGTAKPLPSDGVPTELGGILYLVNLLTWLNLPGGWDEDGTFAEHFSGWAIVEALARGLLGSIYDRYIDDPIWSILALLDGREPGTAVGANFPQQSSFRLPTKWLQLYGPAEPVWVAMVDDERLLIFDEVGGYLVADVPLLGRSPEEVLAMEVETYRKDSFSPAGHSLTLAPTQADQSAVGGDKSAPTGWPEYFVNGHNRAPTEADALNWWLERVLGFVRYLLARALGEPSLDPDGLAEILLCKRGQLLAGRTHIDLHMSMVEINLPIRRAGLDRDPSWVPDLGRIVLFHFD
jgi:hypothetical protein